MVAVLSKPVTSVAAVRDTRAAPNKRARTMRETDSTPAKKKKGRRSVIRWERRDVITRHGRTEQLERGKVGCLRVEMRGDELRKRWQRTKTLEVRYRGSHLPSFSFASSRTHLFFFRSPSLPFHDTTTRGFVEGSTEGCIIGVVVAGCKLCHYSIIHPPAVPWWMSAACRILTMRTTRRRRKRRPRERVQRERRLGE